MAEKVVYFKNLKGIGGYIKLDDKHILDFDKYHSDIASAPYNQKNFWMKWERYGIHIILLDDYLKMEAEKKAQELKNIIKDYIDKVPNIKEIVSEALKEGKESEEVENTEGD